MEITPTNSSQPAQSSPASEPDFYIEQGLLVYTAAYHLKRGSCCGSGCRHCPYDPKHTAGTTQVQQ